MKFLFKNYVILLKECCNNPHISNDDLIRDLLLVFDENEEDDIDPSDASHIMNREIEIPKKVKKIIEINDYENWLDNFRFFYDEKLDHVKVPLVIDKIIDVIKNDKFLPFVVKDNILNFKESSEDFLLKALLESIRVKNKVLDKKIKIWSAGKNEINAYFGDIFKLSFDKRYSDLKKYLVIPVNTQYDLKVDDEDRYCVSSNTLHGQWILKIKENGVNISIIKNIVKKELINASSNYDERIGMIIPYKYENSTFLLLAISTFIDGIATTSKENLKYAILKLIDYYNLECQGNTLFIPLMGTGRSRLGMDFIESFNMIKDLLLENKNKIQGNVNILIYFKDAEIIEEVIEDELL